MTITQGAWRYNQFVYTPTIQMVSASGTEIASITNGIANAIVATGQGWSIQRLASDANKYTFGSANCNFTVIEHTSGSRLVICCGPNNTTTTNGILAANTDNNTENREIVSVAYLPVGQSGYTGNPSSGSFFSSALAFRFSRLIGNLTTSVVPHLYRVAVQGSNCWITMQFTTDAASVWRGCVLCGEDIIDQTIEPGDVYAAAQLRWNTGDVPSTISSPVVTHAQVWTADGATRRGTATAPYTSSYDTTVVSVNTQALLPAYLEKVKILRSNADVTTTGIVAGRGIKGFASTYAHIISPSSVPNKGIVGTGGGQFVHLTGGLLLGWDDTYGPMP